VEERRIVDLKPEPAEEGEILYDRPKAPSPWRGFAVKIVGIAAGVALFLVLLTLFVYVVVPVVAVLVLFAILRRFFR